MNRTTPIQRRIRNGRLAIAIASLSLLTGGGAYAAVSSPATAETATASATAASAQTQALPTSVTPVTAAPTTATS